MPAERTHDLRRRVLRDGRPDADVRFTEDEVPDAFSLAALSQGTVVGVASFSPEPTVRRPGRDAWRLRGMAVASEAQGRGVGRSLLEAAVERLVAGGAEVLWANGRDAALGFYERAGWRVEGGGFTTPIGLPHHVVVLDLAPLWGPRG